MITFTKILNYNTGKKDKDVFRYVNSLLSHKIDPHSLKPKRLKLPQGLVYYSPLKRSKECLLKNKNTKYKLTKELKEVKFSIPVQKRSGLIKKTSYTVREEFIKQFIADTLLESRKKIFTDIQNLLNKIILEKKPVSLVSHSFRLKLYESFIKTRGKILKNPQLIKKFINPNKRTYDFGEKFKISLKEIKESIK